MSEVERRQKQFLSKAQHKLKEVEHNCRDVIEMSQQLSLLSREIQESEVNSRKVQFVKSEIKEKLKEFASFIDEIYKILDRKIIVLMNQIFHQGKEKGIDFSTSEKGHGAHNEVNRMHALEKDTQKTNQRSNPSIQNDRFLSDTLNPRVHQLEQKIVEYQQKERVLNSKIGELRGKNEKLMGEFTKLSNASNKKINQLSYELNNVTARDRDSFNSFDSKDSPVRQPEGQIQRPFLLLDERKSQKSQSPRKNKVELKEQGYQEVGNQKRPFTFGCMPSKIKKQQSQQVSFARSNDEYGHEAINKQDRHRRFDLMLNKLRYGDKEAKPVETMKKSEPEEYTSVFSKELVKRYQV